MDKENIKASVIIPTKDDNTRLFLTLKALSLQSTKNFEVIIIFDNSRIETIHEFYHQQFSLDIHIAFSKFPFGRSAARNRGIELSENNLIIFLDADSIPHKNFVANHIKSYNPGSVTLGIRKRIFCSKSILNDLEHRFENAEIFNILEHGAIVEKYDVITKFYLLHSMSPLRWMGFYTNNISFSKSDLKKSIFFDEKFKGWGWEDCDFGISLLKQGFRFVRNENIINYHLDHPTNLENCIYDEKNNYRYIIEKYKNEILLKICILINHILCSSAMKTRLFLNKISHKDVNHQLNGTSKNP